jgi:diguanylate cyclase (GGDEF)-like protein/PAS domain S-box-containing protein
MRTKNRRAPSRSSAARPSGALPQPAGPSTDDLQREIERLNAMLDTNSDWIWEVDAQGRYTYASRHALALLGYDPREMLGRTPFDFMPPDEAARVGEIFGAIVAEKRAFAGLINRNRHRNGHIVVLETSGIPLFGEDGGLLGYRGIDRDVTMRDAEHARLRDLARRDDLTQLGNRLALRERLNAILDGSAGGPDHVVVLLDLDLFKAVNDSLGHKAGDMLLAQVAARLDHATAQHAGRTFRLGGDEFVVVGEARGDAEESPIITAIEHCFLRPFDIDGTLLCIAASRGVATCRIGEDTPELVLARADEGLYRAKGERPLHRTFGP